MWICVYDQMPSSDDERIIICNSDGKCTVARWDDKLNGWNWDFGSNRFNLCLNFMWWMKAPLTPFEAD